MTVKEFINSLIPGAVETYHRTGVLPSITIAQAALESGWGESGLAKGYKNLFGIKGTGTAGSVELPTWEEVNGVKEYVLADFRVYNSFDESIFDHAALLLKERYTDVRTAPNYKAAAFALYNAGYATDSQYPTKLISIINENKLYEIDSKYTGKGEMIPLNADEFIKNKIIKPAYDFTSPALDAAAAMSEPGTVSVVLGVAIGGAVLVVGLIMLLK